MKTIFPVYEFRPSPTWLGQWSRGGGLVRFNGGQWTEDDGEYDLAFASLSGPPLCLYVDLPYHRNILWGWLTAHWSGAGPASHPWYRGSASPNPWHYMLKPGAKDWGRPWDRDAHENRRAGDLGMSWVSSRVGCANGRHVEFRPDNPHIRAGLVRVRETKEIVVVPNPLVCMYGCDSATAVSAAPEAQPRD